MSTTTITATRTIRTGLVAMGPLTESEIAFAPAAADRRRSR